MRIVFLRSNPVDPDSRVEKEVNSLIKAGHVVEILAWDRSDKYTIKETVLNLEAGDARIYRLGIPAKFGGGIKSNLGALIIFQIKMYKWLYKNRNNYDIIHACDFDTAYTAFQFSRLFKKKLVYDIFDYYVDAFGVPSSMKAVIEKIDKKIINSADAVIICTEKRKQQISGTNPKRLEVIHNTPAKMKSNLNRGNFDEVTIKIVYVGILDEGRFIKEIADIVKNHKNYEFHVGGFGQLESYFREISKKHNNIIFYGKIPYNKTLELENNCDIMTAIYDPTVPNHYYAAPNKFYESLMIGKPLIMARNTGMDDVVEQYNIGEIIEYNLESLENGIENLIKRKSDWPEISRNMKELYEVKYSWKKMEKRLINLYGEFSELRGR